MGSAAKLQALFSFVLNNQIKDSSNGFLDGMHINYKQRLHSFVSMATLAQITVSELWLTVVSFAVVVIVVLGAGALVEGDVKDRLC